MLDDRQIHLTLLAPCSCFCQCRANVQDKSTNRQQAEGAIYDESCNANANSLSQAAASWATLEETDSQKARPAREASLVRLVTSAVAPRSRGSADPELARQKIANLDTIHRAHGPQGPDSLAEHQREYLPTSDIPESLLLPTAYAPTLLPASHSEACSRTLHVRH